MKKYLIRRLLFLIPIMLVLSFFVFALTYLSPSDPVTLKYARMGATPDKEMVERTKEEMGLNDPFIVQYGRWLGRVLHGDLGESYKYGTSVWQALTERIPNTLMLAGATILLTVLIAVPLGILCAVYQNKFIDYLLRLISFFGVSMPSFWVGFLLMYLFGVKLKLLPVMGSGNFRSLILPSLTLAFWMVSLYVRRVRGSMLEEMNKDYLTGGLARGLPKRQIILRQILPNSLLSVVTMFGMSIGNLMGGATVVETIFEWQGVGKMAIDAISVKDFPVIQGYILWMAMIYVLVNLGVDLLYHVLDPRVRLEGGKR
ncbi:MAG: ABC transporter permease [Eubacterium sp.]|nr:ABC transporter permease [Eubacterium sp.]